MKKLKNVLCLSLLGLVSLSLVSCDTSTSDRIDEDLTTTNVIEDSYRNFYEIYVASFYDSNGDGIGDLNGITLKLDYIKDLGYNGIWLMPIFDSNSYHKYNANSYYEIDEDYGTLDDLKNLINECHERDIILIIDLMINHSSRSHPDFIKAATAYGRYLDGYTLTEEEEIYKDYYVFSETAESGYSSVSGYSNSTFYVESNFDSDMPEYNLDNEYVVQMFYDVASYWLNLGIDGFRLDAVIYFYLSDTSKNVEWLHNFMEHCKSVKEDVYVIGEAWTTDSLISTYYQSGLTAFFNFGISSEITRTINLDGRFVSNYLSYAQSNITMAGDYTPAPFLDNHDKSRVAQSSSDNTKFYYGLLAMLNGCIYTYYGDEIGTNGTTGDGDQNVRRGMYWQDGDYEGKCDDPTGTTLTGYIHPSVEEQLLDENSILNYYKKANLLRNQNPEIARGEILDSSYVEEDINGILIMDKQYQDDTIRIIINASSGSEYTYTLDNDEEVVGQLCAKEDTYIKKLDSNSILIPSYGIAIIR